MCTSLGSDFLPGLSDPGSAVCLSPQEHVKVSMMAVHLSLSTRSFVGLLFCLYRLCVYRFRAHRFIYLFSLHHVAGRILVL